VPTDEEIREICRRLLVAKDHDQFQAALTELKISIREHITDAENRGIHLILQSPASQKKAGVG